MGTRPNQKTRIEVFAENVSGSNPTLRDDDGADYLVGEISYHKGGVNYFTGNTIKRGYRIAVNLRTRGNGFESFVIGDNLGKGEFLIPAHAFSAKALDTLSRDTAILAKLHTIKAEVLSLYRARQAAKQEAKQLQAV